MLGTLRRYLVAFLILGALVALAYHSRHKIHLADFTWRKLVVSVSEANVWVLLLCVVGIYGCYALRAVRWQRFCRYMGSAHFANMFKGTVMGFASIFILGRAGEPIRPLLLARKDRLPVPGMFGIFFLERFFDFGAAGVMACLSLLVFPSRLSDAGADMKWVDGARHAGWLLLGGVVGLVGLLSYYRLHGAGALDRWLERWRAAGGLRMRFASVLAGVSEGLQAIRTMEDLLAALFYTAAHWGLAALLYFLVAQAFGSDFPTSVLNYPGAMLLLSVTLVGSVLQLPGVGGGAQVAAFIGLTKIFGVEQEPAAAIAMVLWLVTFAASVLVGLPLLIHEGMSMGELLKLARAEAAAEEAGTHVALVRTNGQPIPSKGFNGRERGESPR